MRHLKFFAVLAILFISSFSTVLAVEPTSGFSVSPTSRNKVNPGQFTYETKPGSTIQDSVTVTNHDSKPMTLYVYGTDSKKQDDKVSFKTETEPQTEVGKWTAVSQKEIKLEPNSSQNVAFEITIPQDAELRDYLGGISGEVRSTDASKGSQVKVNYRIVTKLNLKVTNTPQPIEKLPGKPLVDPAQAYFYFSAGLFVLVLAWFTNKSLKERKHRKANSTHHHKP